MLLKKSPRLNPAVDPVSKPSAATGYSLEELQEEPTLLARDSSTLIMPRALFADQIRGRGAGDTLLPLEKLVLTTDAEFCLMLQAELASYKAFKKDVVKLRKEFENADKDQSESLDPGQLNEFLKSQGIDIKQQSLDLFDQIDTDHNGTVEFDEVRTSILDRWWCRCCRCCRLLPPDAAGAAAGAAAAA